MTRHFFCAVVPAVFALASLPVGAETVYRCGNAYSQSPCGAARAIEVDDSRSADAQAQAMRIASSDQRLGDRMEQQRLASESRMKPARAVEIGPVAKREAVVVKRPVKKHRGVPPSWATSDAIAVDPVARARSR